MLLIVSLTFAFLCIILLLTPKVNKNNKSIISAEENNTSESITFQNHNDETTVIKQMWENEFDDDMEFSLLPKNSIAAYHGRFPIISSSTKLLKLRLLSSSNKNSSGGKK
ncbi:MAG: hypothetical protein Mars2KO_44240 [Maribacter sp.]